MLVRVTLKATLGDRTEVNTFHYDLVNVGAGADDNDPQSLADTFRDDVRPAWAQIYRPRWTIEPVEVVQEKDPQNPTAPRSSWTSGSAIAGTSSGSDQLLPSAMCIVAKLTTEHVGRRFRGRNFFGGDRGEGEQNDGVWDSSIITYIDEDLLGVVPQQPDISPPLSSSTARWCVYSRTQRAQDLDPYASAVTGWSV